MPLASDRRRYDVACPIACALDTVGERWTLLILRELLPGPLRFSEIKASVSGINATILSRRLDQMTAEGLVRLVGVQASAMAYEATARAGTLWPILLSLAAWGADSAPTQPEGLTPAAAVTAFLALRPPAAPRRRIGFSLAGHRIEWQPERRIPLLRGPGRAELEVATEPEVLLDLVTGRLAPARALAEARLVLTGDEPGLFLDHLPRPA